MAMGSSACTLEWIYKVGMLKLPGAKHEWWLKAKSGRNKNKAFKSSGKYP